MESPHPLITVVVVSFVASFAVRTYKCSSELALDPATPSSKVIISPATRPCPVSTVIVVSEVSKTSAVSFVVET